MDQVQPLLNLLSGHFGVTPALMAWMSAVRLVLKPFNAKLQSKLTDVMAEDAKDPKSEQDWETLLHKRWYRLTAVGLDLFFSVKLPTHVDLTRLAAANAAALPRTMFPEDSRTTADKNNNQKETQ